MANAAQRKHMATKPLHSQPDQLRDVVEKLLSIFCTDPLVHPLPTDSAANVLATPGSKTKLAVVGSKHTHTSPFDLPSGARMDTVQPSTEEQVHTGSPVSRKAKTNVLETF
jgi:hypothetical protein